MPTDVVMPQMGESIAEGTIVRWIKKVGDQVARDEPLFEISTDKVDANQAAAPSTEGVEDRIRRRSSPLVRRIAQDHNVDISRITGTGIAGRVTKRNILEFIEQSGGSAPQGASPVAPAARPISTPG